MLWEMIINAYKIKHYSNTKDCNIEMWTQAVWKLLYYENVSSIFKTELKFAYHKIEKYT